MQNITPNPQEVYNSLFCQLCNLYTWVGTHMCPVKTYDLYTSRLDPRQNRLWQQPKTGVTWNDEIWYTVMPLGKMKIQDLMPTLYTEASLSKRYTNHCIRATTINILGRNFATRKVMRWTGHKSEDSIRSYAHKTSTKEKHEMSGALDVAIRGSKPKKAKENKPPVTESVPKNNQNAGEIPASDNIANLSFGDLLQLSPEEEQKVLKELFSTELEIPGNDNGHNANNVVASVSNNNVVQPSIMPKMMFNNSNITINFTVNK